jgi:two-component system cell cycle sensor histidine kinase/response regulator CckA
VTHPLRVLMVEDSPIDATLVLRELSRGGRDVQSQRVDTALEMHKALATCEWDVVISDWSMPTFSALEALAMLRRSGKELPFIIVSGTIGEETAVEAMRSGAQDFVLKDRLARLVPAVERELRQRETRDARGRAEHALRISEARFASLAASGIIAISVTDVYGIVREANDAYLSLIGYSRADFDAGVIGWSALTAPESAADDEAALIVLQTTGVVGPREKVLIRKDGTRAYVLEGGAMLDDAMCIYFHADVTDRKRAEEALRQSEEQLRQAQKMEAVGLLAGGVAHDFNNMLSVILSYASMLKSDLMPSDPMRVELEEIRLAGLHAAGLTKQLLAFSRRQLLRPTLVNLNEIVAQTDSMLRRMIGEDVELVRVPGSKLPSIFVDVDQITQVLMNLAVNARDAMPGGGKLTIETSSAELDAAYVAQHVGARVGRHVVLTVSDNGTGIDKETQERVIEPFFTTKAAGEGTGLGLSTVFGIVKQSGGFIWLYSEKGVGTSFRVYFPVAPEDVVPFASEPAEPVAALDGAETILLVEDEERVRTLACAILRRYGYNVLAAAGGGDALLISEQHPASIHLLLTDVVMPHMSGRQLADRLKPLRPDLKVLYMSGYTASAIVRHGVIDSDVSFVEKPITPETLARAVRRALDAKAKAQ